MLNTGKTMPLSKTELTELAANLFDSYDEGFEGDTPLTDSIIARAEVELGYKLPADYTALMRLKNGGNLKRRLFHYTDEDGAQCSLMVRSLYGIDFTNDSALCGEMGSRFLEDPENHALPHVGIYFAEEDNGHGFFALDYRNIGANGEPPVINIYQDDLTEEYIADSFAGFVRRLTEDE